MNIRFLLKSLFLLNGYLGLVRQLQEIFYNNRVNEAKLSSPDFEKVANSFNIKAMTATKRHEAELCILDSLNHDGPVVV